MSIAGFDPLWPAISRRLAHFSGSRLAELRKAREKVRRKRNKLDFGRRRKAPTAKLGFMAFFDAGLNDRQNAALHFIHVR